MKAPQIKKYMGVCMDMCPSAMGTALVARPAQQAHQRVTGAQVPYAPIALGEHLDVCSAGQRDGWLLA